MATSSALELQGKEYASDSQVLPATPPSEQVTDSELSANHAEFSLPQADGGKDAYLFLAACFIIEALVWGFPFAFGVFQDYYRTHEPFAGTGGIPIIGTCCLSQGIMYLDTPLILALQRTYPRACLYTPLIGLVTMCASLAASSFAQETWHLVLTQGVLYGICGSIGYLPCILYMEQWSGRLYHPSVARDLPSKMGIQDDFEDLGYSLVYHHASSNLLHQATSAPISNDQDQFLQPQVPPYQDFLIYQSANIIEGIGYFLPAVYLPTYARSVLSAGHFASALTVILINVASVFGVVIVGTLSDRLHPTTCILISTAGAVLGTFLLWGLAANLVVLYTFCIVYGFFAGSYISVWPAIMRHVADDFSAKENWNSGVSSGKSVFEPILIWGFLVAGRGIGNIASGPLSEALIKGMPWRGQAAGGYGSGSADRFHGSNGSHWRGIFSLEKSRVDVDDSVIAIDAAVVLACSRTT
ncbi:major facilitator superfamily transporter [Fusarium albosuccineum]|uniref:Major facilitator superfamily transporter n=1 Tax=Fusarium albosuccineum TaxID=1237068 RepID=A0A8H4L154_9HYPO|nr:major facilitator superfamily transporter [Fusarium albosuccineum]